MKNIFEYNGLCQKHQSLFSQLIRQTNCCLYDWSRQNILDRQVVDYFYPQKGQRAALLDAYIVLDNGILIPCLSVCHPLGAPFTGIDEKLSVACKNKAVCRSISFIPRINFYGALFVNFFQTNQLALQVEIHQPEFVKEINFMLQTQIENAKAPQG